MARRTGRTLSTLTGIEGEGWFAWVAPSWHDALAEAGWLRPDPLAEGAAGAEALPERGGRGGLLRVTLSPGTAIVRPFRRGGALGALLEDRYLSPRRPLDEAQVCAALAARGAPVPEAVMALAWRVNALWWRGLIATREIPDVDNGLGFLARAPAADTLEAGLAAVGRALRTFHDAGGEHPDLNLGNVVVSRREPRAWIIDLDGARLRPRKSARARMRELMRLFRSLRKSAFPDRKRLAIRVFHHYCAGDRALRSALLRWYRLEQVRVAIHALRYER